MTIKRITIKSPSEHTKVKRITSALPVATTIGTDFDSADAISLIDSAYINARVDGVDSDAIISLVDSAYVQARVTLDGVGIDSATAETIADEQIALASIGDLFDVDITGAATGKILKYDSDGFIIAADEAVGVGLDSAAAIALIDSDYVQARVTIPEAGTDSATVRTIADEQIALADTHDSAAVQGQIDTALAGFTSYDSAAVDAQIDSAVTQAFIDQFDTHDSAAIQAQIDATINALDTHDSAAVQAQIDATVNALDTHDSAAVQGQIDATVNALDTHDSAAVVGQINLEVDQAFINQFDTHDSAAVQGQIDTTLAGDVTVGGNLTVDGYIAGPTTMTIDPATVGTDSGTLIILGNLQVEGETTTVNSTTVSISDKNIVLADSATNSAQADDAGITVNGANATIQYKTTGDKWEFNKPLFHGTDRVLTTADDLHDSDLVQGQIDATVNALDTHDSAATLAQINAVVDALDTHDSAAVLGQINATVTQSFIDGFDTHDSAAVQGQIDATVNALDTHDSAAVVGQINTEVDKDFIDALAVDYNALSNKPAIPAFGTDYVDSGEVNILIAAADTHDSAATLGQINAVVNALDTHDSAAVAGQISATSIGDLVDVDLTGIVDQQVLKWDSANSRFIPANDATAGGAGTDADTLDGQDGTYYLNYNNFTNTPTIPAHGVDYVDSAITSSLIDSALNVLDTHDSAAVQGQIDASLAGFTSYDSAAVDAQIDSAVTESFVRAFIDQAFIDTFDTHDSAAIQGQIDATLAVTDTHDSAAVLGQINSTVNQSFIDALDTHDSAAVVGQINAVVNQAFIDQFDTHDSAAIQAMIDATTTLDADTVDGLHANQFLRSDADDTTTGSLTVEGNLTTSNLITFEGDSATVANLTTAIVATAAMTSVQAIEATVVSVNATSGERQVSRVLLTHDTTDTYMNEYAVINTGASDEFTLDADTSGGDFRLKLDNISGNTLFAKSSITYL